MEMCLAGVYLFGASWFDIRSRRIPNWWSFLAVIGGGLVRAYSGETESGLLSYAVGILFGLAVFVPFFVIRVLGAGDVKMIAFLLGYLGFSAGIRVIVLGFMTGALWGLVKMILQHSFWRRMMILKEYIECLLITKKTMPYYQAERDECEGVIPFAVCLLLGFLEHYLLNDYI